MTNQQLDQLNDDVLRQIFSFLNKLTRIKFIQTNKYIHSILNPLLHPHVNLYSTQSADLFLKAADSSTLTFQNFIKSAKISYLPDRVSTNKEIIEKLLTFRNLTTLHITFAKVFYPDPLKLVSVLESSNVQTFIFPTFREFDYFLTVQEALANVGKKAFCASLPGASKNRYTIPPLFVTTLKFRNLPVSKILECIPPNLSVEFIVNSFTVNDPQNSMISDLARSNRLFSLDLLCFETGDPRETVLENVLKDEIAASCITRITFHVPEYSMHSVKKTQIKELVETFIAKLPNLECLSITHDAYDYDELVYLFKLIDGANMNFSTLEYAWVPGESKLKGFEKLPLCVKILRILVTTGCGFGGGRQLMRLVNVAGGLQEVQIVRGPKAAVWDKHEMEEVEGVFALRGVDVKVKVLEMGVTS